MRISDWSSDVCSSDLSGNKIYGNDTNAVLIHNGSETITLTGNHLKTVDKANALDVGGSAKVVSNGNWYEGSESNTVQIQSTANGSSFKNDMFVDGGASEIGRAHV